MRRRLVARMTKIRVFGWWTNVEGLRVWRTVINCKDKNNFCENGTPYKSMIVFAEHSFTDHEIWEEVIMYVSKLANIESKNTCELKKFMTSKVRLRVVCRACPLSTDSHEKCTKKRKCIKQNMTRTRSLKWLRLILDIMSEWYCVTRWKRKKNWDRLID